MLKKFAGFLISLLVFALALSGPGSSERLRSRFLTDLT